MIAQDLKPGTILFMTIIVDLDHMLLNTELLKLKMFEQVEPMGVDKELFDKTYQDTVTAHENRYAYDAPTHAEKLALGLGKPELAQEIIKKLNDAVGQTENLVYEDVPEFLTNAKGAGAVIILLTRGNPDWQNKKIEVTGLRKHVDRVVIAPESKGEVLRSQLRPDQNTFFITDNADEIEGMQGVKVNIVQLIRPEGKYQKEAENVPVARTLNQVWDIIQKQLETTL